MSADDRQPISRPSLDLQLHLALLESKGLLESEWGLSENNRRAKFYSLTAEGQRQLREETETWQAYVEAVAKVLGATQPPLPEEAA